MKQILLLGAGLVSRPLVRYLLDEPEFRLLIASRTVSKADALIEGHPRGESRAWTIDDLDSLDDMIKASDLVISLLPATMHVEVAKIALRHKTHMVTTSYVSEEMASLDASARDAGILILNEIGLDPGIDHMSAMKIIHEVEGAGGFVSSFRSYCGGLPAPEANTNPWGYKFSWSPRGVVMAVRNNARFLWDGEEMDVPADRLFRETHRLDIEGLGELEAYPNRDSMGYVDLYGLSKARTMYRGTFRNLGWCDLWYQLGRLDLLDLEERPEFEGITYGEFTRKLIGASGSAAVKDEVAAHLGIEADAEEMKRMEWLGLFGDETIPAGPYNALDIFAARLLEKLPYEPGERDMIVLHHNFMAEYPSEARREKITSTLIDFGIPKGDSSMSRTVSLPAAIGTKLILTGRIAERGVHIPVMPVIYQPVLEELENLGIECKESKEAS